MGSGDFFKHLRSLLHVCSARYADKHSSAKLLPEAKTVDTRTAEKK